MFIKGRRKNNTSTDSGGIIKGNAIVQGTQKTSPIVDVIVGVPKAVALLEYKIIMLKEDIKNQKNTLEDLEWNAENLDEEFEYQAKDVRLEIHLKEEHLKDLLEILEELGKKK